MSHAEGSKLLLDDRLAKLVNMRAELRKGKKKKKDLLILFSAVIPWYTLALVAFYTFVLYIFAALMRPCGCHEYRGSASH